MSAEKVGFWRKLWQEYQQLCKDMGVEQGGCRSCVPKIQFDEHGKRIEPHLMHDTQAEQSPSAEGSKK